MLKGVANHRRIEILLLLARKPDLSLTEIAAELKINFKTAHEHVRRLALAGLIIKRNQGAAVRHTLSTRGDIILKFLRTLE